MGHVILLSRLLKGQKAQTVVVKTQAGRTVLYQMKTNIGRKGETVLIQSHQTTIRTKGIHIPEKTENRIDVLKIEKKKETEAMERIEGMTIVIIETGTDDIRTAAVQRNRVDIEIVLISLKAVVGKESAILAIGARAHPQISAVAREMKEVETEAEEMKAIHAPERVRTKSWVSEK